MRGPEAVAKELVELVRVPNPAYLANGEAASSMHRVEMQYLRFFLVDFIVSMTLGRSPNKTLVLESFQAALRQKLGAGPAAMQFWENLKIRLPRYAEAAKEPHENGAPWTIGKAFSQFCQPGPVSAVRALTVAGIFAEVGDRTLSILRSAGMR
jgi:hypothetical protein